MIPREATPTYEEVFMTALSKHQDVRAASRDLRLRTLSLMPHPLDRLIYLASTRDYNTGLYHHDGLASRFSEEVACEALADCHREAFHHLLTSSLEDIVHQLEAYVEVSRTEPVEFIAAWRGLKPYQVAVPAQTDPISAEFLFSNLRVALAILESRFRRSQVAAPGASLPRSPGQ
jgi:hypothetical protein